jgi:DNA-binding CsgD family transcriptional regulator
MNRQLLEISERLRAAHGIDTFWDIAGFELKARGVESILYGALATRHDADPKHISRSLVWKSTHRREFFDAFGEETFVDGDLSSEHCLEGSSVFLWHNEDAWKSAAPEQKKRASIERDIGFDVGFTVPSSFFAPGQIGGIGAAMPDVSRKDFARYWRHKGPEILTICGMLDSGMRRQHIGEIIGLSAREKECLTWLASGLRPDQIADRLEIGSKSIEKYIKSARGKLKANTRDHAVAKALIFNLIHP